MSAPIKVTTNGSTVTYTENGHNKTFANTQKLCKYLMNLQLNAQPVQVYSSGTLVLTIHDIDYAARVPGSY